MLKKVPQIRITNGLYFTGDRVAYFYYDPQMPNQDTLFHEATHQLFYENDRRDRAIAMDANFWIIEGIACYMESYHSENGQSLVGDPHPIGFSRPATAALSTSTTFLSIVFPRWGCTPFSRASKSQKITVRRLASLTSSCSTTVAATATRREHLSEIYRAGPRQRQTVRSLSDLTGVAFP